MSRSQFKYSSQKKEDPKLISEILRIKEKHSYYGVPKVTKLLHRKGFKVNHKKVYRLIKNLKLQAHRKRKRNLLKVSFPRTSTTVAVYPNHVWAMDFVQAKLKDGTKFRCFTLIDTYSRRSPLVSVARTMGEYYVVKALEELGQREAFPETIVCDNGSELKNHATLAWSQRSGTKFHFIDPGQPVQNAFIESFNARFRIECLNKNEFATVQEAKLVIEKWVQHYNNDRPHGSLDYLTPNEFLRNERAMVDPKFNPQQNLLALKSG